MHLWSIIAAAGLLAVIASAQTPARTRSTLVLSIPGAALSVETIEERETKNPDGRSTHEVEKTNIYRDAAGRIRTEVGAELIILSDPVGRFTAALETPRKIAHRFKAPEGAQFGGGVMGGKGLSDVPGKKTRKSDTLGKQTIGGIEFEGTRMTTTSDEQPSLVAVYERWTSKDLGLIGLVKYSGPDGTITSRIQKIDRRTPDPALFVIPDDYRIQELAQ